MSEQTGTELAKTLVVSTLGALAARAMVDFEAPANKHIADWISGYAVKLIQDEG